jgi:hypothetical protein
VRPSVVVMKNFPTEVHCGQHVWCQNLISVSSGVKVAVDLKDAVPCDPLIPASVGTCTAISFL